MVVKEVDKLKFIELLFLFSGSFALLWYSIVKAFTEFSTELFIVFLIGLISSGVIVTYLLKKWLTKYRSEF